jgi:hypothetical protein
VNVGTVVRLSNGREGTVVYHGLDGYGIKWGRHKVDEAEVGRYVPLGAIGVSSPTPPADYPWFADALLREPWEGARLECVGGDFEVVAVEAGAP